MWMTRRQREGERLGDVAAALGVTAGSEKVKVHTETRKRAKGVKPFLICPECDGGFD
jgi:hypothetical protein